VALNTAFVAMAADRAGNAAEGVSQARAMLASGRAVDLLEHLRRVSHELAAN